MKKTAILFGSTTGNTEAIAELINQKLNDEAELINIESATATDLEDYDFLFLGTSTWGLGDLQDDWLDFITTLENTDLNGKTVALFGLGDALGYPDTFVDAMGTIYEAIAKKGCKVVGKVSVNEYRFEASTAVVEDYFVGLPIDEDNASNKTEERVTKWIDTMRELLK